eukprot:3234084-Amphidinium_carterae.1
MFGFYVININHNASPDPKSPDPNYDPKDGPNNDDSKQYDPKSDEPNEYDSKVYDRNNRTIMTRSVTETTVTIFPKTHDSKMTQKQ